MRLLIGVLAGLIVVAAATAGAEALRDPTAPYPASGDGPASLSGPRLQSTFLVTGGERRAVISGRTYRVGDKFDGATVWEIRPYEVVLRTDSGHERVLRMLPELRRGMYFALPQSGKDRSPGDRGPKDAGVRQGGRDGAPEDAQTP